MVWSSDIPVSVIKDVRSRLEKSLDVFYDDFCSVMDDVFKFHFELRPKIIVENLSFSEGMILKTEAGKRNEIKVSSNHWEDILGFDCEDCFQRWVNTKKFILGHELGHLYHYNINPEIYNKCDFDERMKQGNIWLLGEIVADLSSLLYFSDKEIKSHVVDFAYINGGKNIGCMADRIIFEHGNNTGNFLYYLSGCDIYEGDKILSPYKKYLDNCYQDSSKLYFGMCDHKEFISDYRQLSLF